MALARALAASANVPLWQWLAHGGVAPSLPVPHFNALNGGVHAANELDFQELMIAPIGARSMAEAVRAIALDLAASEFRQDDGRYKVADDLLDSAQLIDRLAAITDEFPVHLIEDGLGEDDDESWIALTARLGGRVELVGDDNFCTNPAIITSAIGRGIANASLIKLNQIGTVTETLEAMAICRRAGYRQFVSHPSGETEDTVIADLAVGTGCAHLKSVSWFSR